MSSSSSNSPDSASSSMSVMKYLVNKPIIAGGLCVIADHYVMGVSDWQSNLKFGAAVAGGTAVIGTVSNQILDALPNMGGMSGVYNGKTIVQRVLEIGGGSVGAYLVNRFVFNNDFQYSQAWKKVGIVAASQLVAEYYMDASTGAEIS